MSNARDSLESGVGSTRLLISFGACDHHSPYLRCCNARMERTAHLWYKEDGEDHGHAVFGVLASMQSGSWNGSCLHCSEGPGTVHPVSRPQQRRGELRLSSVQATSLHCSLFLVSQDATDAQPGWQDEVCGCRNEETMSTPCYHRPHTWREGGQGRVWRTPIARGVADGEAGAGRS